MAVFNNYGFAGNPFGPNMGPQNYGGGIGDGFGPGGVENFGGPPKIDCLSVSGSGSVKLMPEHDVILSINIIYKNLTINKPQIIRIN